MRAVHRSQWFVLAILLLLPEGRRLSAQAPAANNPYPYNQDEPVAKTFSPDKAAEYLNGVSNFWIRQNSCGACHVNYAFMMLRPMLTDRSTKHMMETRRYLEQHQPDKRFNVSSHVAATAFALAWDDARTSNKLQPTTRDALARMWKLQRPQGDWQRLGCGELIPAENDRHHAVALAALAAGVAPEGYARSREAQDGLTRLRRFLVKAPPTNPHGEAMLLWASMHLDGLLTAKEREAAVKTILERQRSDGGWAFAAFEAHQIRADNPTYPSDGYATGFAVFVLRQAGLPAARPEIARGVAWLKKNQRESGRWFTAAPSGPTEGGVGSRDLYAQNHATAFSLLALHSCNALDRPLRPAVAAIVDLAERIDDADVARRAKEIVDTYDSCEISQVFTLRGAGIGSAVLAGHRNSIEALVIDWSGPKPPTQNELVAHHDDLLRVSKVLQSMAALAPHRAALFFPGKDQRGEEMRKVAADFKLTTRGLRDSVSSKDPVQVRDAAVRLRQSCLACHKVVGI